MPRLTYLAIMLLCLIGAAFACQPPPDMPASAPVLLSPTGEIPRFTISETVVAPIFGSATLSPTFSSTPSPTLTATATITPTVTGTATMVQWPSPTRMVTETGTKSAKGNNLRFTETP